MRAIGFPCVASIAFDISWLQCHECPSRKTTTRTRSSKATAMDETSSNSTRGRHTEEEKTNKLFSLSQHNYASQCKGLNTSEHRATQACGVFTASPGAHTHQPCKPLGLPCHSVHSPFILNSTTSHVRRLLITLTLVACWCVGTRVCHCTPLILRSKTARSPRGPPASGTLPRVYIPRVLSEIGPFLSVILTCMESKFRFHLHLEVIQMFGSSHATLRALGR